MEEDINEVSIRKNKLKNFFLGWAKDNYDKAFIAILALAFILRFIVFLKTMDQTIWWDAADYLATAKRWAGFNPNLLDMWYYRRGFLWPLIGAVFFKFGLGEIGIRFLITLFSTGVVFVSYLLISKMFNKKIALLTSICLVFSWVLLFFQWQALDKSACNIFFTHGFIMFLERLCPKRRK